MIINVLFTTIETLREYFDLSAPVKISSKVQKENSITSLDLIGMNPNILNLTS